MFATLFLSPNISTTFHYEPTPQAQQPGNHSLQRQSDCVSHSRATLQGCSQLSSKRLRHTTCERENSITNVLPYSRWYITSEGLMSHHSFERHTAPECIIFTFFISISPHITLPWGIMCASGKTKNIFRWLIARTCCRFILRSSHRNPVSFELEFIPFPHPER